MKCPKCKSVNIEFLFREDNTDIFMCNACDHCVKKEVIWTVPKKFCKGRKNEYK